MSHEAIILIIGTLVRVGFAIWAVVCVRYIWASLKRGHVYINGQAATRVAEPMGFWLVLLSVLVVALISSYFVVHGL
jgi:hypothetical protein